MVRMEIIEFIVEVKLRFIVGNLLGFCCIVEI